MQAIVHAFGLDERTVADWRDRAGIHCQKVHQQIVEQGQLDLMHVQADEIRVKGCKMMAWMGLAMMVSTRLWLGGVVQLARDRGLADQMPVPGAPMRGVLAPPAGVDRRLERLSGQHPPSVPREGQANCRGWTSVRGLVWPELHIGTVIKRTEKKRVVEITRRMASGLLAQAEKLLMQSQGGSVLNTAFIERLNATFRERRARLTRKSRHAARRLQALETGMYLLGCAYNCCFAHHELSKAKHWGMACTPAMESRLD